MPTDTETILSVHNSFVIPSIFWSDVSKTSNILESTLFTYSFISLGLFKGCIIFAIAPILFNAYTIKIASGAFGIHIDTTSPSFIP